MELILSILGMTLVVIILALLMLPVGIWMYDILDYIEEKKAAKDMLKLMKNREKANDLYQAFRQKQTLK